MQTEEEQVRLCPKQVILCLGFWFCGLGSADAWVKEHQPFPEGEATVVLHWFCQRQNCNPEIQEQWWQDMIQEALNKWNAIDAGFMFQTRRVRSTDDPCNLPGEVAVILTEDGRLCQGDGPMRGGPNTITGRTEYRPTRHSARVYIKAPDDFLFEVAPSDVQFLLGALLVHEFGHVVGLGHPDQAGQQVSSVMNSNHSPFDQQPLADDIAGAQALYSTQQEPEALVGFLGNPRDGSSHSGVSVISGWVCEAETVEIQIWSPNGGPVVVEPAAYGTSRPDTAYRPDGTILCGDTDNGFGLLFNWNNREEGEHIVDVLVDGELLDRATVYLTNFGTDFLRGASGRYVLEGFPKPGQSVVVEWEEALQNFVIVERR